MNETLTVAQLISQLEFANQFLYSVIAIVVIIYLIFSFVLERSEHRIWKQLRELDKEIRELERKKLLEESK